MSLRAKLHDVDRHEDKTRIFLHSFLDDHWDELVTLAKGRLVTGHFVWGDRNFKEWDQARLLKECAEELADAINYSTERWNKLDQ